ncbi:unnamed protein product [Pylaiella littoralis]
MAKGGGSKDDGVLRGQYWLTRLIFLRCLGFVYAAAFLSALRDNGALLGEDGLLPAVRFMSRVQRNLAHLTPWEKVLKLPTIFWFVPPTAVNLWWVAATGAAVSCLVAARGAANLPAMALLWALYHSLVNVGQTWYSFGWESQLLETGFLAMFLVPWLSLARFPEGSPASLPCVWGNRWLLFRIMLGAGLIKMRGDACWRDLTCMDYHYQTQPNPNPLSPYLHHLPSANWHKAEVVANHIIELVLPWCLLLGRRQRCFAGCIQILFQMVLVASGNLSFLNWLTAVPAVFSFDDLHLAWLFRRRVVRRLVRRLAAPAPATAAAPAAPASSPSSPQAAGEGEGGGIGGGGGGGRGAGSSPRTGGRGGGRGRGAEDGGGGGATTVGASSSSSVDTSGTDGGGGGGNDSPSSGFRRPVLSRAQSSLQWSSESEDGEDKDKDKDHTSDGKMPSAVATTVLEKTPGSVGRHRPQDSFSGLRFKERGSRRSRRAKTTAEKPPRSPSLAAAPCAAADAAAAAAAATNDENAAPASATATADGADREEGGSSRKNGLSLASGGRALRGAKRVLRWAADGLLVALVVRGSVPVVKNMAGVGGGQKMNLSFDSLRVVNTYGNFGSVTKTRGEVVLKGTRHRDPLDPAAEWREYGECKPGDVNQRPCVISPFHYRLDWQMWFAAFQSYAHNPWLVSLVSKLLSREDETRALAGSLLRHDPFSHAGDGANGGGGDGGDGPPLFIKADLYLYEFTAPPRWFGGTPTNTTTTTTTTTTSAPEATGNDDDDDAQTCSAEEPETETTTSSSSSSSTSAAGSESVADDSGDDGRERGAWWTRKLVREYLPPVGLDNPSLRQFLTSHGLESK